jgi:hypothetical protein
MIKLAFFLCCARVLMQAAPIEEDSNVTRTFDRLPQVTVLLVRSFAHITMPCAAPQRTHEGFDQGSQQSQALTFWVWMVVGLPAV